MLVLELHFTVDAYHTSDDVTNFSRQLVETLRHYDVIRAPTTQPAKPTPRLVYASLSAAGDDRCQSLCALLPYDTIVANERMRARKAALHAASGHVSPSTSGHATPSVRVSELLRQAEYRSHPGDKSPAGARAPSSDAQRKLDEDIQLLSQVYCRRDTDASSSRDANWRGDLLSTASQVNKKFAPNISESREDNSAVAAGESRSCSDLERGMDGGSYDDGSLQTLEQLYCQPMFDEELARNLTKQL